MKTQAVAPCRPVLDAGLEATIGPALGLGARATGAPDALDAKVARPGVVPALVVVDDTAKGLLAGAPVETVANVGTFHAETATVDATIEVVAAGLGAIA